MSTRRALAKTAALRGRPSAREAMLDAAQAVVLKQGAASLTLDAVAREAQVSKGGVMYHFPTKQALLTALGERMIARNQSRQRVKLPKPEQPTTIRVSTHISPFMPA